MSAIRSFIAIDLQPEANQRLEELSGQLRETFGELPVRWLPLENVHLTLKFLGEVSEANVGVLAEILQAEAAACQPFDVSIGGLGVFPAAKRPRVIWVGVEAPDELLDLHRRIDTQTARLGYPPDKRDFSPHLTLGRVLRKAGASELREIGQLLDAQTVGFLAASAVRDIHLYKSDLKPSGAVYTHLAAARLGAGHKMRS